MTKQFDQHEPTFGEPERPRPFRSNYALSQAAQTPGGPMQTTRLALPRSAGQEAASRHRAQSAPTLRVATVGIAFLCLFGVIGWRLLDLAWTLGGEVDSMTPREIHMAAQSSNVRAPIVDRNGELLAVNLDVKSLFVDPRDVLDVERTINGLASVFPDKDPEWIRNRVTSQSHFRWIERELTPSEEQAVRRLGLPGVRFSPESRRHYPKGELVSQLVGFTDLDNQGLAGFEYSFDSLLTNSDEPLALSIDVRAQHIIAEELQYAMDDFTAPTGAAVLMDANTSEIVAMVSLPTFDPYNLDAAKDEQLFNQASQGVYELGSIFKVFTLGMAMELDGVKPTDKYDISEPLKIGRWEIEDYDDYGDVLTAAEVLVQSSNIGTGQMALDVGAAKQQRFLGSLGLLREANFELNQVGRPGFPSTWGKTHTATVSFGHGISVSPLQATNAFNAMVNGGVFREPTLIRSDSGYRPGTQIMRPETSYNLNSMLRLVVTKGTGKNANAEGYQVGGKTGTADLQSGGGYDENRRISSFLGAFPIGNPQYSMLVVVYDPKPNENSFGYATGGWVAAPAFKRIVERLGPILGVAPTDIYPEIIAND